MKVVSDPCDHEVEDPKRVSLLKVASDPCEGAFSFAPVSLLKVVSDPCGEAQMSGATPWRVSHS